MDYISHYYERKYAPNTRETIRRATVHQFIEAVLVIQNPDNLTRATNSKNNVYQIEENALKILKSYGKSTWKKNWEVYLSTRETLRDKYAREREMSRIPVTLPNGTTINLSPGGQNVLIKDIIEEFGSRFTPNGKVLYIGDSEEKFACYDNDAFERLGIHVNIHGKMPDVVIEYPEKEWLILIEAVTSHGPIDPKRRNELIKLFDVVSDKLVFVTAFLDRKTMTQYSDKISWETEVWIAEAPSHLIHYNGERFLGPHEK